MNEPIMVHRDGDVVTIERAPLDALISPELLGLAAHAGVHVKTTIVIEATNGTVTYEVVDFDRNTNAFMLHRVGSVGAIPE